MILSYYEIMLIILGIGMLVSLFLAFKGVRRAKGLQRYEQVTDSLALRKIKKKPVKKPEEDEEPEGAKFTPGQAVAQLISGVLALIVMLSVSTVVMEQLNNSITDPAAMNATNHVVSQMTDMTGVMLNFTAVIMVIVIIMSLIVFLRSIFDPEYYQESDDDEEEAEERDPNKHEGIYRYEGVVEAMSLRDEE